MIFPLCRFQEALEQQYPSRAGSISSPPTPTPPCPLLSWSPLSQSKSHTMLTGCKKHNHKALLFIYERHEVYARLYGLVAPVQKPGGDCLLPPPRSDVESYLQHQCGSSTFCRMVVTVARLTERGTRNFCPTPRQRQREATTVCFNNQCTKTQRRSFLTAL